MQSVSTVSFHPSTLSVYTYDVNKIQWTLESGDILCVCGVLLYDLEYPE